MEWTVAWLRSPLAPSDDGFPGGRGVHARVAGQTTMTWPVFGGSPELAFSSRHSPPVATPPEVATQDASGQHNAPVHS